MKISKVSIALACLLALPLVIPSHAQDSLLVCRLALALVIPSHAQDSPSPPDYPNAPPPDYLNAPPPDYPNAPPPDYLNAPPPDYLNAPPPDYLNAQDSQQDYLNAHNAARTTVGVGSMSWDDTVAAYAQNYLNQHIGDCNMVHSGGPYGENLAWSSGDLSGTDAVAMWVNEKADYNYNSNTCATGKVCGHYTQVVWRNSVRLGCAKVSCNTGGTLIGCNYDPRGNIVGKKPY